MCKWWPLQDCVKQDHETSCLKLSSWSLYTTDMVLGQPELSAQSKIMRRWSGWSWTNPSSILFKRALAASLLPSNPWPLSSTSSLLSPMQPCVPSKLTPCAQLKKNEESSAHKLRRALVELRIPLPGASPGVEGWPASHIPNKLFLYASIHLNAWVFRQAGSCHHIWSISSAVFRCPTAAGTLAGPALSLSRQEGHRSSLAWEKFQHDSQNMALQACITASRHTKWHMRHLNWEASSSSSHSSSCPPYWGLSASPLSPIWLETSRAKVGKAPRDSPASDSCCCSSQSSMSSTCPLHPECDGKSFVATMCRQHSLTSDAMMHLFNQ